MSRTGSNGDTPVLMRQPMTLASKRFSPPGRPNGPFGILTDTIRGHPQGLPYSHMKLGAFGPFRVLLARFFFLLLLLGFQVFSYFSGADSCPSAPLLP